MTKHSLRKVLAIGATVLALSLSACSSADEKKYDIQPIFPMSADKCTKYNGDAEGTGLMAHCWVTLADCERAAGDWAKAMKDGGVQDAIHFTCK